MPPEIPFALVSLACLGLSDLLYRHGQRYGIAASPFMLLQNLAYVPTALAFAIGRGELVWAPALAFGLLNGALAFTAFLCLLVALRQGDALSLVPIVRLNFAVTGALTVVFLGEALTPTRLVALAMTAAAILAVGWTGRPDAASRRSTGLAVVAMCAFGLNGLFYKLGLGAGAEPTALVLAQSIGVFCLALPFSAMRREPLPRRGPAMAIPLACGVLTAMSYVTLSIAFTHGDAVVVAPIAQLSFVLTAVLAVTLLGERLTWRKGAGITLAVLSVSLFALG